MAMRAYIRDTVASGPVDDLTTLVDMRARGVITEAEFEAAEHDHKKPDPQEEQREPKHRPQHLTDLPLRVEHRVTPLSVTMRAGRPCWRWAPRPPATVEAGEGGGLIRAG
jgi:hypothetical protein